MSTLPQLAKLEMSAVFHDGKTLRATDSTGPQVFQTVHWNMAWKENIMRMYHLLLYTAGLSWVIFNAKIFPGCHVKKYFRRNIEHTLTFPTCDHKVCYDYYC